MNTGTLIGVIFAAIMGILLMVNSVHQPIYPDLGCITDTECEQINLKR